MKTNLLQRIGQHFGWSLCVILLLTGGLQAQTMAQNTEPVQEEIVTQLEEVPQLKNWSEVLAAIKYPDDCFELGLEGLVPFDMLLSVEGKVLETKIPDGVHPSFLKAINDALVLLVASPGIYKGHPIKTWISLKVSFDLKAEKKRRKKED